MAIAGRAVGAESGILYLRAEYGYMRETLDKLLEKLRANNLLGKGILGDKAFNFDIVVRMGMGAYVCGEETALIESLEGRRGEPRNRFPFPVQAGYQGMPTVVNNVETFATVSCIMEKGPEWFSKVGTKQSAGFRLLSISGDCKKPGIYEVPFGISLNDLLKLTGGEGAKAIQVGGASGTCVPAKDFGRKLAFEDLATGGSIIIFGPKRNMFDVADNFQAFFAEESCGQCTPCRIGNVKLLEGVKELKKEGANPVIVKNMRDLAKTMPLSSKCGLGQSCQTALLSILDNFSGDLPQRKASK